MVKRKRKSYGIKDIEDYSSLGNIADAEDSVWGGGRNKWKRFPATLGGDSQDNERIIYRERTDKPVHVVHEDYKKRKHSEDVFGMYGFSIIVIIVGIIITLSGAGSMGIPFIIIGILAFLFVRWYSKWMKRHYHD